VSQGWRTKLFQEEYAARKFALFLLNSKGKSYYNEFEGTYETVEVAPIIELRLEQRPTGPWEVRETVDG